MILGGVQSYWIYNVLEKEFLTTSAFSKGARRGLARNGHTVCASLSGLSAESTEMKGGKKEERRRKRRERREGNACVFHPNNNKATHQCNCVGNGRTNYQCELICLLTRFHQHQVQATASLT